MCRTRKKRLWPPTLIIYKVDSRGNSISGATFAVYQDGNLITTVECDDAGIARVSGLSEGYFEVEELTVPAGFILDSTRHGIYLDPYDPAIDDDPSITIVNKAKCSLRIVKYDRIEHEPMQTAYISGKQQDVVQLYFGNSPKGALLVKKIDSVTHKPLAGVEFMVTTSDGAVVGNANGKYTTDSAGTFLVDGLDPGLTLVVKETRAKDNYILDDVPQTVKIKSGETVSLEFRNQPASALLIMKKDAVTGKPLAGVEFLVTDSSGGVISSSNGKFTTDSAGAIRVDGLTPGMTVIAKETRAKEGYLLDNAPQSAKIKANETVTLEFLNQPAGSLVIVKRDTLTGKPLEGVTFKVTTSTGEYVPDENGRLSSNGLYWTDKDGKITINGVVGSLVVTETKSIPGYSIDPGSQTQTVVVYPNDTQEDMFRSYCAVLNSLPTDATTKITINNRRLNGADFRRSVLMRERGDGLDQYRREYNTVLT